MVQLYHDSSHKARSSWRAPLSYSIQRHDSGGHGHLAIAGDPSTGQVWSRSSFVNQTNETRICVAEQFQRPLCHVTRRCLRLSGSLQMQQVTMHQAHGTQTQSRNLTSHMPPVAPVAVHVAKCLHKTARLRVPGSKPEITGALEYIYKWQEARGARPWARTTASAGGHMAGAREQTSRLFRCRPLFARLLSALRQRIHLHAHLHVAVKQLAPLCSR